MVPYAAQITTNQYAAFGHEIAISAPVRVPSLSPAERYES